jgi:hypothetical protein
VNWDSSSDDETLEQRHNWSQATGWSWSSCGRQSGDQFVSVSGFLWHIPTVFLSRGTYGPWHILYVIFVYILGPCPRRLFPTTICG